MPGNAGVDVGDGDLGRDVGHHLLLVLDAGGVDDQYVGGLGDHGLHLVHLDDRILVGGLEQQLKPLLPGDLLRLHLTSREVRRLQLLLGEADHDVVDVGLDAVGRALGGRGGGVNPPAGAEQRQGGRGRGDTEDGAAAVIHLSSALSHRPWCLTWLPTESACFACGRTAPWPASPRPGLGRRAGSDVGRQAGQAAGQSAAPAAVLVSRPAEVAAGPEWVTTHTFRNSVVTLPDGSGTSARMIADQLRHSRVSMTQDVHLRRRVADALEALLERIETGRGLRASIRVPRWG